MDTTGSMYWHLASVRSAISSQIVNNPSIKKLHPLYILTSFNDPYAQIETVTEDVDVFQAAVNSLVADGGGDCPEMAGAGILLALSQSIPGGQVWVFTDASAKDHSTWSLAIHVALQKRITINFALTGSCSCNDPVSSIFFKIYSYHIQSRLTAMVTHTPSTPTNICKSLLRRSWVWLKSLQLPHVLLFMIP
jgi:hypothetical protein